jgi:hypothetical protein
LLAISSVLAFAVGAFFVVLAAIAWIVWFAKAGFAFAFVLGVGALVKMVLRNGKQETGGVTSQ